ncbi:MAG TPA: hypothetical protein VFX49_22575, partial [Chloroflexota bacterium]|nr:hypothetical protein [Chloroflexota bacterium]
VTPVQAAPTVAAVTPVQAAPTAAAAAVGAAAAAVKVSANRASRAELQRAFEAAGIPNAVRMAVEVEEYRPYPTNDPNMAKLRQELSKYNIPTNVVSQIIATLTLD